MSTDTTAPDTEDNSIMSWVGTLKSAAGDLMQQTKDAKLGTRYQGASSAIFPISLQDRGGSRHTEDHSARPVVKFENMEGRADIEGAGNLPTIIYLPAPPGAAFSDQSQYNDKSLGAMGGALLDIAKATHADMQEQGVAGGIEKQVKERMGDFEKVDLGTMATNIGNTVKAQVADKLKVSDSGIANAAIQFMGTTANPNVVTEYTSTSTRQFSMSYKLMPKSQNESEIINNIIKAFRFAARPSGNYFYLKYPPKWKITFHQGINNDDELVSLPRLDYCYLMQVQATANSNNAWYYDGQPTAYDIVLTWQERKVLTADQILKLETGPQPERGDV